MIHRDQKRRRTQRPDRGCECGQLLHVAEVARKQDYAPGERVQQSLPIRGIENQTRDIEHDRAPWHGDGHHVRTAASRSSAFIWRTASRIPTNTARDTIAWPM